MEKAMEQLVLYSQEGFNKALFESMAELADTVWAFSVDNNCAIIMHDRLSPHMAGKCLTYSDCMEWVRRYNTPEDAVTICRRMNPEYIKNMKKTERGEGRTKINGSYHLIKYSVTPSLESDGRVRWAYFSMLDCQEIIEENAQKLQLVNAELKSTRAELNRYLSAVTCGIIQYRKNSKELIFANDIALNILGYSSLEEMQEDGFDGVVKTVYEEDAIQMKFLMEGLKSDRDFAECEYRVHHKDGRELLCYGNIKLITDGDDDPIIQRSMIDITDSRINSRVFRETTSTLARANMGMWSINLGNGRPKFFMDEVTTSIVGAQADISPEDAYTFWYERVDDNFKGKVAECVSDILSGKNSEVIYPYRHPKKGIINVRCGGAIDPDYMGIGSLMRGYHQDITDMNEMLMNQIEISNNLQSRFIMVAHIDLEKETFSLLEDVKGLIVEGLGREGELQKFLDFCANKLAFGTTAEFAENVNIHRLKTTLSGGNKISFVSLSKYNSQLRHQISASAMAGDGSVARGVYTISIVE